MRTTALALLCLGLAGAQFHAQDKYAVADGFDLVYGTVPSAVDVSGMNLPPCTSVGATAACILSTNASESTYYTDTVASSSSRSSLFSSTTHAEGGGWGVTASASVSYMTDSAMSTRSVDLVCGAGVHTYVQTIHNPSLLKLTDTAATLLENDPKSFLEFHGPHFITSVTYGASFLGSVHFESMTESHSSDLDVFASISASEALFSASASESLEEKASEASATVHKSMKAAQQGGDLVSFTNNTAFDLGQAFRQWYATLSMTNTVPIYMEYENWYRLDAVQAIVDKMSPENKSMFGLQPMTKEAVAVITEEITQLSLLQSSVNQADDWACPTTNSSDWRTSIGAIKVAVQANLTKLEAMSETDALAIQLQIEQSNTSWQGFNALNDQFVESVGWYKDSCGGSTYRTVTAYWDPSLAGGECETPGAAASPQLLVAEGHSVTAGSCFDGQCELNLLCVRQGGLLQVEHHVGAPCSRDYTGPWVSSGCSTVSTGEADGRCCFL